MNPTTQTKHTLQKTKDRTVNNYPPNRKSPVRLTEDEQFAVYKYCIENRCVYQVEAAIEFRVEATKIANEIVKNFPKVVNDKYISSYHVKSAVENTVGWQKRLGKLPIVPLETVEIEQLKIDHTKHLKEIEQLKYDLAQSKASLEATVKSYKAEIEHLKSGAHSAAAMVDQIRELVNGTRRLENQP